MAVTYNPGNYKPALACSADGKVVYCADSFNVLRSDDFGENWKVITPDETKGNVQADGR